MKNRLKKINPESAKSILYPLAFGIFIVVLWQTKLLHQLLGTDTFTIPLFGRIFRIILDNPDSIWLNLKATAIVAVSGLFFGSILGYFVAIIAAIFPKGGIGGLSLVSAFSAIPLIAIAPILTNLTKDFSEDANTRSMFAKMLAVMIFCTASMSVNAFRGLTELKPFTMDLMHSYAAGPITIFFKLRIPNSVPYVFTALKVSVPGSVISALVSEYFAEYVIGVGRQIRENIVKSQYATAWAYILVACALGITMYIILLAAQKAALKGRK